MTTNTPNPGANAPTLASQLAAELNALGTLSASQSIDLTAADRSLHCELASLDRIGCEFMRLEVATAKLAGAATDQLQKIAEALSTRLTYLLEPISPIEVDQQGCTVQMRSSPPQRNDDGTQYYELLVRAGGQLSLARYRKPPGAVREAVAAQVTREVLLKLAGDLESAV
jgi:hypothetical protein